MLSNCTSPALGKLKHITSLIGGNLMLVWSRAVKKIQVT